MGKHKRKVRFYTIAEEEGYTIDSLNDEAAIAIGQYIESGSTFGLTSFRRAFQQLEEADRILMENMVIMRTVEVLETEGYIPLFARSESVMKLANWAHKHNFTSLRDMLVMPEAYFKAQILNLIQLGVLGISQIE